MVKGPLTYLARGGWQLTSLVWRKWYLVITFLILIPSIISSVSSSIEERNPMIIVGDVGLYLISADEAIYEDRENFEEIIPKIEQNDGIISKAEYWARFFWNLLRKYFTRLWMILFNFLILYWIFQGFNSSKKTRNKILALLTMIVLQVFISLILLAINQDLKIPDVNLYSKMWFVVKSALPFKGIVSLFKFVFDSIVGV